jgi:hypothetical protein
MNRSALAPALTLLLSATLVTTTFARQATPAATKPATPAATSGSPPPAAAKAKFATPLKGEATIDVIQGASKIVGKEVVKTYKIKNTSSAPIAMLKVDEYYYSKTAHDDRTADPGCSGRRKPRAVLAHERHGQGQPGEGHQVAGERVPLSRSAYAPAMGIFHRRRVNAFTRHTAQHTIHKAQLIHIAAISTRNAVAETIIDPNASIPRRTTKTPRPPSPTIDCQA